MIEYRGVVLAKTQYNKKVLEIVLPDTLMNVKTISVLKSFQNRMGVEGIDVWYRVSRM